MLSAWAQWQAAGGAVIFDASFAASIGGYPKGAVLAALGVSGYYWICTADNNTNNPETGGANWVSFNLLGTLTTGDVKFSLKNVADPGWVLMNDGSIGDASSGATTLASVLTKPLFTLIYNNIVDTWAPLQTSGGGATTRGAQGSAATAYAAHCRIVLPPMLGRALAIAGAGSGLTARALGQSLGEENHQLTTTEMPIHNHSASDSGHAHSVPIGLTLAGNGGPANAPGSGTTTGTGFANVSIGNTGGNGFHNNMQPSSFLTAMVAL
jgi:microcystin-dependent protein